jgi:assimilatory nitrate reductase catalytic subunit
MNCSTSPQNEIKPNSTHTTCAYCGVGCGIKADIERNKTTDTLGQNQAQVVTISGLDSHPSNLGKLCSKGSALGETLAHESRLLYPEILGEHSSWDETLDYVANQFSECIAKHGADSVAFYLSGQLLTEDYYVANKLMKGFIGSANVDTNSRLCMSSSVVGHKRAFGTDTVPACYEDIECADLITIVGSNTAWCHPVLFQRIKRHKERNPHVKIVVIDPRRTQTCDIADLHLPVALGSDTWLFNGLLTHLANTQAIDHSFISQHCNGFEEALAAAQASSSNLEAIANACNLETKDLAIFFTWFTEIDRSLTLYSQGVNQSSRGTDKVNSILNCHLATGRIGKPGSGPLSLTGQPNAMGGREVGGLANTLAAHMDFNAENINRLGRFWQTSNVAKEPGLPAVDMFDAIHAGKIKAVWIMATNPAVSLPNTNKVKQALAKCETVIVSDCVNKSDTLEFATVKLPATGWSEKDGTVTNSERRISRQRALFSPAGEAKHDWWAITQVAQRMGYTDAFNYKCAADIFREHAALSGFENSTKANHLRRDFDISLLSDINNADYEALAPKQWPLTSEQLNGTKRFFAHGAFYTPDQKARFIPISPIAPQNKPCAKYPLTLNTGRIRDQWHTMTRTALAPRLNQHISEPYVELHPKDALHLGIKEHDLISLESAWGTMTGRSKITKTVMAGSVFAPMHWTASNTRTGLINKVVNPVVDPFSNQPESKHTPVRAKRFNGKHYGFVLTRHRLTEWPTTDYLTEIHGSAHTHLEFAHQTDLNAPLNTLFNWLGYTNEEDALAQSFQVLRYEDKQLGIYRLGLIDKNEQLHAVAILTQTPALPERQWLSSLFTKPKIDTRARHALLSGYAPAGEDVGNIICACFSVGDKTIAKAIAQGCCNVKQVGDKLKAGTNCGSCIPEIKSIIKTCETIEKTNSAKT